MLVIALLSVICKGEDYEDMEIFGVEREKWLKEELGLELANGIPSGDTFRRLFERMNPKEFRSCLDESIGYVRSPREVVNIDGKAKKGSGIYTELRSVVSVRLWERTKSHWGKSKVKRNVEKSRKYRSS